MSASEKKGRDRNAPDGLVHARSQNEEVLLETLVLHTTGHLGRHLALCRRVAVRRRLELDANHETKTANLGDAVANRLVGLELAEKAEELLRPRGDVLEHPFVLEGILHGTACCACHSITAIRTALRASLGRAKRLTLDT